MTRFLHWRKMTWMLVLWTAGMGAWLVSGALTAPNVALECATDATGASVNALTSAECVDAAGLGSLGSAIVIGLLWLLGLAALAAVWFMSRPLWRQGHGARLRRLRPADLPWLYDEATILGTGTTDGGRGGRGGHA